MSDLGQPLGDVDGRSRPRSRSDTVRLTGPAASTATQDARRPTSSQVPSTSRPSGASRPRTRSQAAPTSSSAYCRSTLNARTTVGRRPVVERDLEPAQREREAGPRQRLGRPDPLRVDLDPDDLDVAAHPRAAGRAAPARSPARRRSRGRRRRAARLRRRSRHPSTSASQRSTRRSRFGLVVPRVTDADGPVSRHTGRVCRAACPQPRPEAGTVGGGIRCCGECG